MISIKRFLGKIKRKIETYLINNIKYFKFIPETANQINPITFKMWFRQRILGENKNVYWPISRTSTIVKPENICIGIDTSPGYSPGCYIQGIGKIFIGDYTGIAPNVGIISANHSMLDFRIHERGEVRVGKYCWIGMGAVILPNVILGDFTTVRAGAVVSDSFEDGYCVIGGNPAKLIMQYPKAAHHLFKRYEHENKYIGFIEENKFESFREHKLKI
jgi:acetyltransferase-like isoleucine patch superfamily enzyme